LAGGCSSPPPKGSGPAGLLGGVAATVLLSSRCRRLEGGFVVIGHVRRQTGTARFLVTVFAQPGPRNGAGTPTHNVPRARHLARATTTSPLNDGAGKVLPWARHHSDRRPRRRTDHPPSFCRKQGWRGARAHHCPCATVCRTAPLYPSQAPALIACCWLVSRRSPDSRCDLSNRPGWPAPPTGPVARHFYHRRVGLLTPRGFAGPSAHPGRGRYTGIGPAELARCGLASLTPGAALFFPAPLPVADPARVGPYSRFSPSGLAVCACSAVSFLSCFPCFPDPAPVVRRWHLRPPLPPQKILSTVLSPGMSFAGWP